MKSYRKQCNVCARNMDGACFHENLIDGQCSNYQSKDDEIAKLRDENRSLRCELSTIRNRLQFNMSRLSNACVLITSLLCEPLTINGVVYENKKALDEPFTIRSFQSLLSRVRDTLVGLP